MHVCDICEEEFEDWIIYEIHKELFHTNNTIQEDNNYMDLDDPFDEEEQLRPSVIQYAPPQPLTVELQAQALPKSVVRCYKINNRNYKLDKFTEEAKQPIVKTLEKELERLNFVKFGLLLESTFTNIQNELSQRAFITKNKTLLTTSNIISTVEDCFKELAVKISEHEGRGSGWSLLSIDGMIVRVHKHGYGNRGSSYIALPKIILNTESCINVKNEDNECFRYAMLAKFLSHHQNRPNRRYHELSNKYNFRGITYPVSLTDIKKFERQNSTASVNVYALDKSNNVYPLRITSVEQSDHTDLLLLKDGDISHYVFIKNFNRLLKKQLSKTMHSITVCKRCFCYSQNRYNKESRRWLIEHQRLCNNNDAVQVCLPSPKRAFVKFDKTSHQYRIPIVIYADFESSLVPLERTEDEPIGRTKYQLHHPNSYCLMVKSTLEEDHLNRFGLSSKPEVYRGENASQRFVDRLYNIANNVERLYEQNIPMINLEDDQLQQYTASVRCYLCQCLFTEENHKVRDHDHLTGKFRGPACNSCNLNYKVPKFIPVVLHNLSGYDAHFIVPELGRDNGNIDVLATTTERFISFSKKLGKLNLDF